MKKIHKLKNVTKEIKKVKPIVWLVLILIFALLLRLYFFVGIGFNDDSYYLEFAETIYKNQKFVPPLYEEWGVRIAVFYPVILSWKLLGISEMSTSIYFLLLSLGSVIVTYLLGKELFNEKIGLLSAFLLSIFPLDIIYSTQVGPDIPFQLLSAVSVLCFIKGENDKKTLYSFLSGLFIGLSYIAKSEVLLLVPILAFYLLLKLIQSKKGLRYFKTKDILRYVFLLVGFLLIFSIQLVHFYTLSGEWFYGEKVRDYSFTHDMNSNSDLTWYIRAMFNLGQFFEWVHSKPYFGFTYYFVVLSSIYLLYKKDKNSVFLIFWFLFIFFFFEYGLQFYCTKIVEYCNYVRHPRFLSAFSIPSMILLATFFMFNYKAKTVKKLLLFLLVFLVATSIFYTYQSYIFLRNGMGYLREAAYFLKGLQLKNIYIPDRWTISKFKFFFGYNDTIVNRLRVYECNEINCMDELYNSGKYIHDSYVVTQVSPYSFINNDYPGFMLSPPNNWILLKNITLETIGLFSKYNPCVYYAP